MNTEIQEIISQLKTAFEGDPWFGKSVMATLQSISPEAALVKPGNDNHSMLQLLYHMINWRRFTLNRLSKDASQDLHSFEQMDWQELDHTNTKLWQQGIEQLKKTQQELLSILEKADDSLLVENVFERNYTNRYMLYGVLQHDIYHTGQLNYIQKLLA